MSNYTHTRTLILDCYSSDKGEFTMTAVVPWNPEEFDDEFPISLQRIRFLPPQPLPDGTHWGMAEEE